MNHLARVHRFTLRRTTASKMRDIFINDEAPDLFLLYRSCPTTELIRTLLLHALVGLHEVAQHLRVARRDDACINV